jgi:outer membrane protein
VLCISGYSQDQPVTVQRPMSSIFVRPYKAPTVPPARTANSDRLHGLLRANRLYLTVQDAIALAVENNLDLEISRYDPLIAEWAVERQSGGGPLRGAPNISSQIGAVASGQGVNGSIASAGLASSSNNGQSGGTGNAVIQQIGPITPNLDPVIQNQTVFSHTTYPQANQVLSQTDSLVDVTHNYSTTMQQGLLTGGYYYVRENETYLKENTPTDYVNPSVAPRLYVNLQHNLLQGFGTGVNSRYIRIARKNVIAAQETFRSQLLDLVANVLNLYWDLASANEAQRARERALEIAEKFRADTANEIRLGALAGVELPRAEAELASRRQDLAIARQTVLQQAILLKDVLSRSDDPLLESAEIVTLDSIQIPPQDDLPPLRELVARAMAKRPDVAVSKIRDDTADLSALGTTNNLLPTLVGLLTAYDAGAAGTPQLVQGVGPDKAFIGGFGTAFGQVLRRDFPSERALLYLSIPVRNRQAQGDYGIDQLQLRQSQLSGQRDLNEIVVKISNQMIALRQARSRYSAAVNTRTLQEQLLQAEQNRFALGASTISDLVIAQRALVVAQTSEVTALSNYARARVSLDHELGETLEVNHVSVDEGLAGRVSRDSQVPSGTP